jgi:hypothetical protein
MRIKFPMTVSINVECLDEVVVSLLACYHCVATKDAYGLMTNILDSTPFGIDAIMTRIEQFDPENANDIQTVLVIECSKP